LAASNVTRAAPGDRLWSLAKLTVGRPFDWRRQQSLATFDEPLRHNRGVWQEVVSDEERKRHDNADYDKTATDESAAV